MNSKLSLQELKSRAGLGKVSNPTLLFVAALGLVAIVFLGSKFLPIFGSGSGKFVATTNPPKALQKDNGKSSAEESSTQPAAMIKVYVVGAVIQPGVYEVCSGSRIQDAVTSAGGVSSDAEIRAVNFAQVLNDGDQIYVPTVEEANFSALGSGSGVGSTSARGSSGGVSSGSGASSGASGSSKSAQGKISINTASATELEALPGVGPSTAAKIVADRDANGKFNSLEDIMRVSGIGQKKFESLAPLITL